MSRLVVIVLLSLAALAAPASAAPARIDEHAELQVLNRINRARAVRGVAPLLRDEKLRSLARYHSADMADGGFVSLVSPSAGPLVARAQAKLGVRPASELEAHVSAGVDPVLLGETWLDPTLTHVGVGVIARNGRVFVTQLGVRREGVVQPASPEIAFGRLVTAFRRLAAEGPGVRVAAGF